MNLVKLQVTKDSRVAHMVKEPAHNAGKVTKLIHRNM